MRSVTTIMTVALSLVVSGGVSAETVFTATLGQQQKTAEVSTEEIRHILADHSATVLDARPYAEFAAGHIPGAVNVSAKPGVPMSQYVSDVAEVVRLMHGNRDAPILLYCNGPFCGKSSRLADELLTAGFTNVRRYQLGDPVWRALGGVMQLEPEGFKYIQEGDRTARIYDVRSANAYAENTTRGAIHLPRDEIDKAKDDGRLPMQDHNTRIVVFGDSPTEASSAAEAIARNAFHNVMFCGDPLCKQELAPR
jgi:rhodanese-related sulfurtransferase